ncbi:MAG: glycosyltransferase family 39 protein [Stellaceae bacterium]
MHALAAMTLGLRRRLAAVVGAPPRSPPLWAAPLAIGLLALALRLYGLGDKPFWLDEVASLRRATASVHDLVADSLRNNHYPSYFLLLWLVAKLGTSQWLLRLPSAVFGAIGAALTCMIGERAVGRRGGLIAGLLMAASPFAVQFGQEARSYTLASCLILVALLGLVRLAKKPEAAARPLHRQGALRGAWLAYGLGTAAALNVLNVAVPWLVAANLGAAAIISQARGHRRGFLRNWGLVQVLILATWLPSIIWVYVASKGAVLDGAGWAPAIGAGAVWSTLAPVYLLRISRFITFGMMPAAIPGLAIVIAIVAALGAWRLRRAPAMLVVLGSAALLLPISLLAVSLFVPVLVSRYFAWSAAPFFILVGAGMGMLGGRRFAVAAVPLTAACLINLYPYYGDETKPRWDLLATRLAAAAQPGDVVLVDSYYSYSVLSVFAARDGLTDHGVSVTWDPAKAFEQVPGHDLWAVYGRAGQASKKQSSAHYRQTLAPLGQPIAQHRVGRYIEVWRFHEPSGAEPVAAAPPQHPQGLAADSPHP